LTSSVNVANKQGSCQRQTQNNNRKCWMEMDKVIHRINFQIHNKDVT
jgi:hypothetical protein